MMLDPVGIMVTDDVKANVTLTEDLPETRSMLWMPSDISTAFAKMPPEEIEFDSGQEFTLRLATPLKPTPVLLPMVNPVRVMETADVALMTAPKMVRMKEVEEVELCIANTFSTLLEPAGEKGGNDCTKK